tara:strand:+ start:2281 stop:2916 length:636 start_codon:yes stop_codon:yes gene_type:complete
MTGNEMLANLGLRLEDPAGSVFTNDAKLDALNLGQKSVVNMVDNNYLAELQNVAENKTVASGVCTYATAFSADLPIRNGIVGIKNTGVDGTWCTMLEVGDAKRLENSYLAGSATNPTAYVFNEKIYVDNGNTAIDVWYLQSPADLAADAVECVLNPSLQELVLDFAEAQLWRMDAKPDRAAAAYSNALNVIKVLNERYQVEKPEGIGTKGR